MQRKKRSHRKSKAERQEEYRRSVISDITTIVLLCAPMCIYCAFVIFLFPAPGNLALSFPGIVGTFCFGCVLSYVANARLYRRKISFRRIFPFLSAAVLIISASIIGLYVPSVAKLFEGSHTAVYFLLWIIFAFQAICYFIFTRIPMETWLRRGKGIRGLGDIWDNWQNFLWYKDIHKEHNIGKIYSANILFTCVWLIAIILHVFAGWSHIVIIPVCILTGLGGILESVLLYLVTEQICSDPKGKDYNMTKNDNSVAPGNLALMLFLLATSVITFGLPSIL